MFPLITTFPVSQHDCCDYLMYSWFPVAFLSDKLVNNVCTLKLKGLGGGGIGRMKGRVGGGGEVEMCEVKKLTKVNCYHVSIKCETVKIVLIILQNATVCVNKRKDALRRYINIWFIIFRIWMHLLLC